MLLILGATLARLVFAGLIGLGVDESYMVAGSRVLALGYYDHPPASWWLTHAAVALFGSEAPLAVRLPFILLFAVASWLMYLLARRLYGAQAGCIAVLLLNIIPVLGVTTGSMVLPDGPLVAALLAATLALTVALERGSGMAWVLAGLAAGLALFSKYSAVLWLGGALLYLLATPRHRFWLARWHPWVALLLALAVFSPVLLWNAGHGWASFAFQGGRVTQLGFHPLGPLVTLGGEALFFLPWLWLPLLVCAWRAFRAGPRQWAGWLMAWLGVLPIIAFPIASIWSSQRILFHWAVPGYLMLIPLLADDLAGRLARGAAWPRLMLRGSAAFVLVAALAVGSEVRWAWLPDLGQGMRAQTGGDLDPVDWSGLRTELAARGLLGRANTLIGASRWMVAGRLAYALGPGEAVICVCHGDEREFGVQDPAASHLGADVVMLVPGKRHDRFATDFAANFARIAALPPLRINEGTHGTIEVPVFIGYGLRQP